MKYGKELAERIEQEIKDVENLQKDRNGRISSFKTDEEDCFLSARIDEQELAKLKKQLAILNTDGCMDWEAIVDENGNEINVHWFKNKWGSYSIVGRGVFASSEQALLKKTGWTKKIIRVPVWVDFVCGNGDGICSAYTGSYKYVRWHTNMVTGEYVGYPD